MEDLKWDLAGIAIAALIFYPIGFAIEKKLGL